jgi:hypothetical protein
MGRQWSFRHWYDCCRNKKVSEERKRREVADEDRQSVEDADQVSKKKR